MADEKKPDEQFQVDSPEAPIVPEEKKEPEKKFEESPEDIEKSRAFHQQQAQEKADQLKEAQSELDQIYADLDAADPAGFQRQPEPTPEKKTPLAEPVLVDEDGQPDLAAIVRHEVGKLKNDLTLDFEQKQAKRDQEQIQDQWYAEKGRALKAARAYQKAYDISDDVFNACDTEASSLIGPPNVLGAYTRWAKTVRRLLDQHQLQSSITQKATTAKANAAAQIDHAGRVAQPSGSAISPPEPGSLEKWNQQQADDIAEDDPPVG